MDKFVQQCAENVTGTLECFDRVIFKGHFRPIMFGEGMEKFLGRHGVLIKDYKSFVQSHSDRVVEHAVQMAGEAGRPYQYLRKHIRKDDEARALMERDGVEEGLVCVYSQLELCPTFKIARGPSRPRIVSARRKCRCLYFYFADPVLGLIHVRLQTWFPFTIQIAVNGHEWLAHRMREARVAYAQVENAFVALSNGEKAQQIADQFPRQDWPVLLSELALRVNPLFESIFAGMGYYWTVDQAEYATDILFRDRRALGPLYRKLVEHAFFCFSPRDVLGFLGKKLTGNFKAEVLKDFKQRAEGMRIKHRVGRNWIKMYDKHGCILRVETVINDPYGFLTYRRGKKKGKKVMGWFPMTKGVTGLSRYAEVARSANHNYISALAVVQDPAAAQKLLQLCARPVRRDQKCYRGFNPAADEDHALFKAVLQGEHHLHGFQNADVRKAIYPTVQSDRKTQRRLAARIRRKLKRLHVRGLIAKIPHSRRWRVTRKGHLYMGIAVRLHEQGYIDALLATAA
jgi:hypothetical protein